MFWINKVCETPKYRGNSVGMRINTLKLNFDTRVKFTNIDTFDRLLSPAIRIWWQSPQRGKKVPLDKLIRTLYTVNESRYPGIPCCVAYSLRVIITGCTCVHGNYRVQWAQCPVRLSDSLEIFRGANQHVPCDWCGTPGQIYVNKFYHMSVRRVISDRPTATNFGCSVLPALRTVLFMLEQTGLWTRKSYSELKRFRDLCILPHRVYRFSYFLVLY